METFNDRIKKSLGKELYSNKMNKELIDYLIDKIIDTAIEKETSPYDINVKIKDLTNSFIAKAEEINLK